MTADELYNLLDNMSFNETVLLIDDASSVINVAAIYNADGEITKLVLLTKEGKE